MCKKTSTTDYWVNPTETTTKKINKLNQVKTKVRCRSSPFTHPVQAIPTKENKALSETCRTESIVINTNYGDILNLTNNNMPVGKNSYILLKTNEKHSCIVQGGQRNNEQKLMDSKEAEHMQI